jgi:potassium-transporting ATPase KdpC subunit
MKPGIRCWFVGIAAAVGVAAIVIVTIHGGGPRVHPVSDLEERDAAELSLAERLSGPRYFHAAADTKPEEGVLWLSAEKALEQVPRIVEQRNLDQHGAAAIRQLIEDLSEPHPYRVVGGARVKLSRLNLSLDEL